MEIGRLFGPTLTKIRNMVAWGRGSTVSDDPADLLRGQADFGGAQRPEIHEGMARPQWYGYASRPPGTIPCVALFPNGNRAAGIIIAEGDVTWRIRIENGEVALYDDQGQVVHLTRTGIRIESPLNVTVKAGQILRLEGDQVHLHAHTLYRFDTNGHGQVWHPTSVDTWQIGETAGAAHDISPPEIS
ncbi:protein of unknown function （phage baseplate assembly protein V&|uniref:phage baseplate assembly protein domain-containing protein n=1 Tax=Magnetospirillum sp. XM-1 TaxID=1663591 RepID=UPI00073DE0CC|nr:phage baseplate assembly protein [Magnetospirillum sp. XM-1]CUW41147.1 protein of unknown function \